jgi:hypothetical protein
VRPEESVYVVDKSSLILPSLWFSIDPGDRNVGVCRWRHDQCLDAYQSAPDETVDMLVEAASSGALGLLVYEKFQLYHDKAGQQLGSEFLTSQMIGAMRHICRRASVPTTCYLASNHKTWAKRELPTSVMPLRAWHSFGSGPHAKDAETLGRYHANRVNQGH